MKNKLSLKGVVYGLAANKVEPTIQKIADKCFVSVNTVYRWMRVPVEIKEVYKPIIAKVLKKEVTELFN